MIEVYKTLYTIYDPEVSTGIGLLKLSSVTNTRGHSLKLCTQLPRLAIRKNCFAVRAVVWNSSPEEVVMSSDWNDQPVKFDYKEELRLERSGHRGKLLPVTSTSMMMMMMM